MVELMDLGYTNTVMELYMRVSGLIIYNMEKEHRIGQMAAISRGNSKLEKKM